MSSSFQARRAEEKIGLILGRIGSIRARLNSLAWQRAAFSALGWAIAVGAIVMVAAFYVSALPFLAIAITLGFAIVAAMMRSIRTAWRTRVDSVAAAQVADRRAELKGRLETIVEIGQLQKVVKLGHTQEPPALWSYLIEDTLAHQEEFEPARIERRRVSRSVYGFLASLIVAALAFPLIAHQHGKPIAPSTDQMDMTLNLNDLHLRAADPDSDQGIEVHADPQTMRRLEARMQAEGGAGGGTGASTPVGKLMNHARDLAGNLQSKLTGRKQPPPRITLRLADNGEDQSLKDRNRPNLNPSRKRDDGSGQFARENGQHQNDSGLTKPGPVEHNPQDDQAHDGQAPADAAQQAQRSNGSGNDSGERSSDQVSNDTGTGSGASHGVGADPDSLFGSASDPKLGSQGFEISIEARSENEGSKAAGHAYLPPKVRTPLNSTQHPDEPIARASVPEEDRAAIKRVFER